MNRGNRGLKRQTFEEAMRERCEEQGHYWVGCLSRTLPMDMYQACKGCGERKP